MSESAIVDSESRGPLMADGSSAASDHTSTVAAAAPSNVAVTGAPNRRLMTLIVKPPVASMAATESS